MSYGVHIEKWHPIELFIIPRSEHIAFDLVEIIAKDQAMDGYDSSNISMVHMGYDMNEAERIAIIDGVPIQVLSS